MLKLQPVTGEGGGVVTIYSSAGCATFSGAFFRQKINFGVSFLVESQIDINVGVSFLEKQLLRILSLIKFHILG